LFQYASERIDTGHDDIDVFESLKTFSTDVADSAYGHVSAINITNVGSGYTTATVNFISSIGYGATAQAVIGTGNNAGKIVDIIITNSGTGYKTTPFVEIIGNGVGATVEATISVDIDKVDSYGDNNSFLDEASTIVFDTNNPFGDI
jgi:hypothetical protein